MCEKQDLTKPIICPILLITEGNAILPPSASDVAPLDSLEELDKVCTVDVFAKLHESDRRKISQQRLIEAHREGIRNEDGTISARKKQHTVLSKIGDQWTSGPISILHKALTNKLRVKVWVRNHTTVRSILVGFVAAFDKHLNLALVDVDEAICLRKDDIKSTTLTPERDLRDLRPVHNEQDYLAIANADEHDVAAVGRKYERAEVPDAKSKVGDEHNETSKRTDAAEKTTNDSEDMYNNNDVSRDHSSPDGTSADAENVQTSSEEPPPSSSSSSDKKTAKLQQATGSDLTKETKQKPRNSEQHQQGKNLNEESLTEKTAKSLAIAVEPIGISVEETVKSANPGQSRKKATKTRKQKKGPPTLSQRYIPQLFVRGEHVVMIAFADV